jgi:Putative DNA-binding domain
MNHQTLTSMGSEALVKRLPEYLEGRCETALLDFKSEFNPNSNQAWCELLKDIVAIANSGGGVIAIGLNDDGSSSASDIKPVLALDPADVGNKVEKYTGYCHSDLRLEEAKLNGQSVACLVIGEVRTPLVFTKPGTYQVSGSNQQKTAFSQGTVYFRHGPKSEPGSADDLRNFIEREVERLRSAWLENVRKVVEAPAGSKVIVMSAETHNAQTEERSFRLTSSPDAPLVRELNPNDSHPYRQIDVANAVTKKLNFAISPYDVFCVRKVCGIEKKPEFFYKPKYTSPQYSDAFVDWFVSEYKKDPSFVELAKQKLQKHSGTQRLPTSDDERLRWLDTFMQSNGHNNSSIARKLGVSQTTVSQVLRGCYPGNVAGILKRVEALRQAEG